MRSVVGLDLSLSRTGMCFVPSKWDGQRNTLRTAFVETKREEVAYGKSETLARIDIERYLKIARVVIDFVKDMGVQDVVKENYAYSPVMSKTNRPVQSASVTKLAELGGVVQSQLFLSCQLSAVSVASNSARKWLTGGLQKGKQKEQVDRFLQSKGFRFDNWDEMDAFVVAYYWYGQINKLRSRFLPQAELDFGISPGL